VRPLEREGEDGRLGLGRGETDGLDLLGELPLPKRFGSVAGDEYLESRKPPGRLAYCESLKPPFLANVLPE
jgi:hypothetical protein